MRRARRPYSERAGEFAGASAPRSPATDNTIPLTAARLIRPCARA
nr:MAG TPA: hypothetical protein [Caudoviricetes sp.]